MRQESKREDCFQSLKFQHESSPSDEKVDAFIAQLNEAKGDLRELNLFGTTFQEISRWDQILEAMSVCTELRSLILKHCYIFDSGVSALLPALVNHKQLMELDLGFNQIRAGGAQALAAVLPSDLTRLNLEGNQIGVQGATVVLEALQGRHVHYLSFASNEIGNELVEKVSTYLPTARFFQLNLDGNSIRKPDVESGVENDPFEALNAAISHSFFIFDVGEKTAENLSDSAKTQLQENRGRYEELEQVRTTNKVFAQSPGESPLVLFRSILQALSDLYAEAKALPVTQGKPVYLAWLSKEIRSEVAKAQATLFAIADQQLHDSLGSKLPEREAQTLTPLFQLALSKEVLTQEALRNVVFLFLARTGKGDNQFHPTDALIGERLFSEAPYTALGEWLFPRQDPVSMVCDAKEESRGSVSSLFAWAQDVDVAPLGDEPADRGSTADAKPSVSNVSELHSDIEAFLAALLACAKEVAPAPKSCARSF